MAWAMPGCMFALACTALEGNLKFPSCAVWHGLGNAWLYGLARLHGLGGEFKIPLLCGLAWLSQCMLLQSAKPGSTDIMLATIEVKGNLNLKG